ncbi:MAG: hypothetical protein AAFN70_00480 [Planctomycetota bacterium]
MRLSVNVQQDIAGFDVSMNDFGVMRMLKGIGHPDTETHDLVEVSGFLIALLIFGCQLFA